MMIEGDRQLVCPDNYGKELAALLYVCPVIPQGAMESFLR